MQISCACGCNNLLNDLDPQGRVKRFIHGHHRRGLSPEKHGQWNGGRIIAGEGYYMVLSKSHPRSNRDGYVYEHILVIEKHLGRSITAEEAVHHINGIKTNNRIENLELMSKSKHTRHHCKGEHMDTSGRVCYSRGSNKT